ncbi:MFS transporter [Actinokineospora guangxiensis]|uniref:MFS transporter n=1 Tax=Actinokineospora guangxiensis TaxID=1490288 RepID=A0ABW0EWJ7_9PSEU
MITLDFFAVNVALPAIAAELGAGPAAVQLVVVGYGLAYAAGLITWGRLGDLHGRRRLFAIGLGLFTAASAACGLAPSAGLLVAARVLQGVAAGMMAPQVLAILGTSFDGPARVRAFAAFGLAKGMAGVFGQLIGGALITADADGLGWRLVFLVNIPIGLLALLRVRSVIPESRVDGGVLDGRGAALAALALTAFVLPLVVGREQGWPVWAWLSLAGAVVLAAVFARVQKLVDVRVFSRRGFTRGALLTTGYYAAMGAFLLVLSLYLQDGLGLGPLGAGLLYTALGAGFLVVLVRGPAVVTRLGGHRVIAIGALALSAGWVALAGTVLATDEPLWLVPALLVCGLGMGLVMAQLTATAIADVPPEQVGAASGVLNTAIQVGSAVGAAAIGVVFYGVAGPAAALAASLGALAALGIVIAASVPK